MRALYTQLRHPFPVAILINMVLIKHHGRLFCGCFFFCHSLCWSFPAQTSSPQAPCCRFSCPVLLSRAHPSCLFYAPLPTHSRYHILAYLRVFDTPFFVDPLALILRPTRGVSDILLGNRCMRGASIVVNTRVPNVPALFVRTGLSHLQKLNLGLCNSKKNYNDKCIPLGNKYT
jgi:hypothetical protein